MDEMITRPSPKQIVAIGDVHGLDAWKPIVAGNPDSRIVFLGDYLDPYRPLTREGLLDNLREIIRLKQSRPDDVVLLLGNHDLHYFCEDIAVGSRFDYEIAPDAFKIFVGNMDLFSYAYQEGNLLFTHAGVSQKWFIDDFKGDPERPIAWQLNHPADGQVAAICRVGYSRGGWKNDSGGIFWADIDELDEPLSGFTQVVGHNRVKSVTEHTGRLGGKIYFCDCLEAGGYFKTLL